ncbi:hypothetical protein [Amycolatopsis anabasis]|uniref:hypothetical protein n=1 Tax=Amycolatopsis anabasis TaxID=1840409 RepID=UPI00131C80BA|nr:hypothetical protein [Amycolatopsis anabasis]
MTAALRLPDAFTPGATSATAATPTCSCCCCCAISTIGASVTLPNGLLADLRAQRPATDRRPRGGIATGVLWLLPGVLATLFVIRLDERHWSLFTGPRAALPGLLLELGGASMAALLLSLLGGSKTSWRTPLRLLAWCVLAVAEFIAVFLGFLIYPLFYLMASAYLITLLWLPGAVRRHYRGGRA